jgi:hypothetical protein
MTAVVEIEVPKSISDTPSAVLLGDDFKLNLREVNQDDVDKAAVQGHLIQQRESTESIAAKKISESVQRPPSAKDEESWAQLENLKVCKKFLNKN